MATSSLEQQIHGYRGGHHLLATSVSLSRDDQDLIDRLSDLSGPLAPGQEFDPYLTTYPLPSGNFYVIARTWQDQAAARAGCVLTRSLLAPSAYWTSAPSLSFLLKALRPAIGGDLTIEPLKIAPDSEPLPPVTDPRTAELIEALFLESRQPVVMFDVASSDSIIARLLAALWPSMRRSFATCGFALAPRSLEGRAFDLLCAPKTAWPRFSDWTGRKIDESAARIPRHRWTLTTAAAIFSSAEPNLSAFDTLGILQSDTKADGAALRIVLLWNELVEKSKASPTAALGLLDILASQNLYVAQSMVPILSHAIELSSHTSTVVEHLQFLLTLLEKFSGRPMPLSLLRLVKSTASAVRPQDLDQVFEFLNSDREPGRRLPRVLCSGIGDSLAVIDINISDSEFARLTSEVQLTIMSASDALDRKIVQSFADNTSLSWAAVIRRSLSLPDDHLRSRATARLASKLDHKSQLPVLEGVLDKASASAVAHTAALLWQSCELKVSEFDEPLLQAAVRAEGIQSLREVVCELPEAPATDRLLAGTLRLQEADVAWLVATDAMSVPRKQRTLSGVLSCTKYRALRDVFSNQQLRSNAIRLLSGATDQTVVGRILAATDIRSQQEFESGLQVLAQVGEPDLRHELSLALLRALFFHAEWRGFASPNTLFETLSSPLAASEIILSATDQTLSAEQLNTNLGLLNTAPQPTRATIMRNVDLLSEQVINFNNSYFDAKAISAWAELISDAGTVDRQAQLRAAEMVLPFALKTRYGPASPLIIETFPLVHAELGRGRTAPNLFTFFFFGDHWDRCDTLRRSLVDAFMSSDWPPADLLIAAHTADVIPEVLKIISSRSGTRDYKQAIFKDVRRLPLQQQDQLRTSVEESEQERSRRLLS
jgi:hypothetical protein